MKRDFASFVLACMAEIEKAERAQHARYVLRSLITILANLSGSTSKSGISSTKRDRYGLIAWIRRRAFAKNVMG
jgi:hypothetical protein